MTSPGEDDHNEQSKREHVVFWLWRWWDRMSSWYDWYQWFEWFAGLLKTNVGIAAGTAAGVTTAAAVTTVVIANPEWLIAKDVEQPQTVEVQQPQTVQAQQWSSNTVVFPVSGKDGSGRTASFEIVVLTKDYNWAHGSTAELTFRGNVLKQAELNERVFNAGLRTGLLKSQALIAVGAASQEGNLRTETGRARRRAQTSVKWLNDIIKQRQPPTAIWKLVLGQYQANCAAKEGGNESSWQRPFMIIAVRKNDEGVQLSEALADAMSNKTNVPSKSCYSSFELERVK